jgi:hypothetical protein
MTWSGVRTFRVALSSPTTSLPTGSVGRTATNPAITSSRSPEWILQAQPPPCAYCVSRSGDVAVVKTQTYARAGSRFCANPSDTEDFHPEA